MTVPSLSKLVDLESKGIWRALRQAQEARLVGIVGTERTPLGPGRTVWRRLDAPSPLTVEWSVAQGGRFTIAWSVLDSLRSDGFLRLEKQGFVPVK